MYGGVCGLSPLGDADLVEDSAGVSGAGSMGVGIGGSGTGRSSTGPPGAAGTCAH